MASKPEFVYFNGRGRGEVSRIALAAAGIEFTESFLETREQFLALQKDLLFGQVPLLRMDGQNIVQTAAIVRHAARKGKLYLEKEEDNTKIDTLYEGSRDFFAPLMALGAIDESKMEGMKPNMEKYLNIYDKVLKENGSGYLVGSRLTLADVGLLEPVLIIVDYFGEDFLKQYPSVLKFYQTVTGLDKIKKYLKEIRKPKFTAKYGNMVKTVLNWK